VNIVEFAKITVNTLPTVASLHFYKYVPNVVVSALALITEVNQRWARLVLRWVTNSQFSVCDQPPRSTQPSHPFVGRRNKYQPEGGNA